MSYYGKKTRKYGSNTRVDIKRLAIYYVCLLVFVLLLSVIEVSRIKIFGASIALAFCASCAIGFIFGEKSGAIFGLICGLLIDALEISGFSINPVLFTLCGYLCGSLVGWILSINLPSFMVYAAVAGLVREIFTVIYFGFISTEFDITYILLNIVLPDFFAFALSVIPIYYATLGIYYLFRGKDKKEFRF